MRERYRRDRRELKIENKRLRTQVSDLQEQIKRVSGFPEAFPKMMQPERVEKGDVVGELVRAQSAPDYIQPVVPKTKAFKKLVAEKVVPKTMESWTKEKATKVQFVTTTSASTDEEEKVQSKVINPESSSSPQRVADISCGEVKPVIAKTKTNALESLLIPEPPTFAASEDDRMAILTDSHTERMTILDSSMSE